MQKIRFPDQLLKEFVVCDKFGFIHALELDKESFVALAVSCIVICQFLILFDQVEVAECVAYLMLLRLVCFSLGSCCSTTKHLCNFFIETLQSRLRGLGNVLLLIDSQEGAQAKQVAVFVCYVFHEVCAHLLLPRTHIFVRARLFAMLPAAAGLLERACMLRASLRRSFLELIWLNLSV